MTVNRGGALSKEYFLAYLQLVINTRSCSVDKAKEIAFDLFFKQDEKRFGLPTYTQFQSAYNELNQ